MGQASALKVGMWIFLISDALTFGGLLLAYGILRAGARQWWAPGEPPLGITFTAGLTFLLICSSVTMVLAVGAAAEGRPVAARRGLALTMLGGVLFLCGQAHEYLGIWEPGLIARGLVLGHSARATTFYVITSFHGLHVLTGVILLGLVRRRVGRPGRPAGADADVVEAAGLFWHFVDLVWILVFTFVYLIPT
jgi:cytochrome c oxidase subunit 3